MARAIRIRIVTDGARTDQLIRAVGVQLGPLGGRVEQGSSGNLMVIFSQDRDAGEARRLVTSRLDDCAENWRDYLEV